MDTPWRIELLGRLRATQGDRVVTRFRAQKGGALLAYLAYHLARPHPREELIELFWPEAEPRRGRNSLSRELSSLRCQLEPPGVPSGAVIVADRACVRLNPAACTTDVLEFEAALQAAGQAGAAAVGRPWSSAKGADPGSPASSPSHPPAERLRYLVQAADRYGGELLPGYFESWIIPERLRLADAYLQLLEELVAHHEQAGDLHGALQYAWRSVAADTLREESQYHLIRLLVLNGQPAAALQQYQELERLLASELGVQPAPEIQSLAGELQRRPESTAPGQIPDPLHRAAPRRHPLASSEAAAVPVAPEVAPASAPTPISPSSASPVPTGPEIRLPIEFTRFFGREEEIDRLRELLTPRNEERGMRNEKDAAAPHSSFLGPHSCRLVTLTGPGGSGKTRLALQAARRIAEQDQRSVWFVPLADLSDARLLGDKIAASLNLPRSPGVPPMEQVVAFLSHPAASARAGEAAAGPLLVLDNFEHLVAEGAGLIRELLEQIPSLTCLVTSRQPLELAGEQEFPIAPLPVPRQGVGGRAWGVGPDKGEPAPFGPYTLDPTPYTLLQFPSVQLFVDRAQAVRPEFQLRPGNAADVAALCARLEGLPLALELAAARVGVLTPAQMLGHLEQRFDFLVSRKRDATPRHLSLRAALDWSYQLLYPVLQQFFAWLSVFRGGWTLEAAEAVCEEPRALEYLDRLRECSLVHVLEDGGGTAERSEAVMRFHLLDTLREYGAEQLGPEEREAVAHRHASYYLAFAERAEAELVPADQVAWRERDLANMRAALAWLERSGRVQEALRLGGALRELITLVAGTGSSGYSGDNGPANQAQLNHPLGLAFDAAGHLFIALGNFDARNHRVRKVDAVTGIITTVAGAGRPGFSGDGSKAADAQLNRPFSVVVDGAGNLFIAEVNNHRVRKVTPEGIITTYAGSGPVDVIDTNDPGNDPQNGGFSGDNGPATDARLNFPTYLAADPRGNLFIADTFNHRVRKVTPDGIITTVAGTGKPGYSGDSRPAIQARLHYPLGLALDAAGNLFVVDSFNYRVRKVTPDGIITTVAGTGERGFSGDGAKATDAQLNFSGGVAVDSAGNLFVADGDNYRVRKVSPEGIITTVAGIGRKPYAGDSGRATETGLRGPGGLAIDPLGNLLISDSAFYHKRDGLPDNERVLKIIGVAAPGLVAGMHFPR